VTPCITENLTILRLFIRKRKKLVPCRLFASIISFRDTWQEKRWAKRTDYPIFKLFFVPKKQHYNLSRPFQVIPHFPACYCDILICDNFASPQRISSPSLTYNIRKALFAGNLHSQETLSDG